jgi:hypothetical protein
MLSETINFYLVLFMIYFHFFFFGENKGVFGLWYSLCCILMVMNLYIFNCICFPSYVSVPNNLDMKFNIIDDVLDVIFGWKIVLNIIYLVRTCGILIFKNLKKKKREKII